MDNEEINSILANKIRKKILDIVKKRPSKISHIAKQTNLTIPAIVKHVKKISDAGLLEKKADDFLTLTRYGRAILIQVQGISFLTQNRKYFESHSLDYLPIKFIERIGDLKNSEIINGFVNTVEEYKNMIDKTEQYVKYISSQVSLDIYKIYFPKMKQKGIKISYMLGENSIVPKGWLKLSKKMGEQAMQRDGILTRRILDHVNIMMFVCEKGALVAFPNLSGTVEPSKMFKSNDERFIEWCNDLYDHLWCQGHAFLEKKIHET